MVNIELTLSLTPVNRFINKFYFPLILHMSIFPKRTRKLRIFEGAKQALFHL